jgi:hypothetical protein
MTFHFIVVTSSEEVHRYIGVKKQGIVQKDVREDYSHLFDQCIISPVLIKPGQIVEDVVVSFFKEYVDNPSGVVLVVEEGLAHGAAAFCESCFLFYFDKNLGGKNLQNYFGMFMHRLIKGFDYYARHFDQETYRKMCILPLRNFKADELAEFHDTFRKGVPLRGFEDAVDGFFKRMRQRQKPKTVKSYKSTYFVDDKDHYFAYGLERHSKPETKIPPHDQLCELNSYLRFGKPYDHDRHFNVTVESGQISGIFEDCHGSTATVAATSHINMFPNDHIA